MCQHVHRPDVKIMELSSAVDKNNLQQKNPAVSDDDRPATARKKRGKRKKKDVHKWIAKCDLAMALDEAAGKAATSDEAVETEVAKKTNPLEGSPRTVNTTPEDAGCRCDGLLCECARAKRQFTLDF